MNSVTAHPNFGAGTVLHLVKSSSEPLLIIASSGRMLAEAARQSGFNPLVIDLCADTDTELFADAVLKVASLSSDEVSVKVRQLTERYPLTTVIYGSGLESYPETLVFLAQQLTLLGNDPAVFANLHDKRWFFDQLTQLGLPYPEVRFIEPDNCSRWLFKPMRSQGGVGIRNYDPAFLLDCEGYWQSYLSGVSYSVLFVANGTAFTVIGFHRQWTTNLGPVQGFWFSAIAHCDSLDQAQQQAVIGWLQKLVPTLGLKGLNSLDFMLTEQQLTILELNPRPSASMQLYDGKLLLQHIHACQGDLTPFHSAGHYQLYRVIYAESDLTIPPGFIWPSECRDLPKSGTLIGRGQPICSIIVCDSRIGQLNSKSEKIQHTILQTLNNGYLHLCNTQQALTN